MTRRTALSLLSLPAFAQNPNIPKSRVPRPSPEFAASLPDGKTLLLTAFKPKPILMEFLLTTCPHCQRASQIIQKLYNEYGGKFQPIGIAVNDMAKMLVPDYVRNFQLTYPVGFAPRDSVYNFLEIPNIYMLSFPTVVGIDKKFTIREQHLGGADFFKDEEKNMRALVDSLLAGGTVSSKKGPAAKAG